MYNGDWKNDKMHVFIYLNLINFYFLKLIYNL